MVFNIQIYITFHCVPDLHPDLHKSSNGVTTEIFKIIISQQNLMARIISPYRDYKKSILQFVDGSDVDDILTPSEHLKFPDINQMISNNSERFRFTICAWLNYKVGKAVNNFMY